MPSFDHDGDIALRGALRDRTHVHARRAQSIEHLSGNARRAGHAVADHRENGEIAIHFDTLNLACLQFALERVPNHGSRALRLLRWNRAADRVLGAALGNENDGNPLFPQRAEQSVGRAGHADHAGALHVHERDLLDAGNPLHRQLRSRVRADKCARLLRSERVADPDRDAAPDGRRHRLRMDDLGAEIGELHRLVVRERVDDGGVRHPTRVRGEHTVHVGPNVYLAGFQQSAKYRAGEIAPVPPEGGLHTARVRCDESGNDKSACEVGGDLVLQFRARLGPLDPRSQRTPLDDDHAPRVDPLHRAVPATALLQVTVEQFGGPDLPVARDEIAHVASGRPGELDGLENPFEIVTVAVEAGQKQPR